MQIVTDSTQAPVVRTVSKKYLILSMRHLGDAVIVSGFINALQQADSTTSVDVLGRPDLEAVTRSFCSVCEYIPIDLPFFGHHKKGIRNLREAIRQMAYVRQRKYDECINLVGDIRENLVGKLAGTRRNTAPIWDQENLYTKHIRTKGAHWLVERSIRIPSGLSSLYDSMRYFSAELGLINLEWPRNPKPTTCQGSKPVIALHPGASQPSKRWLPEKWRALIRRLHEDGKDVVILGSPAERKEIFDMFYREIMSFSLSVITENLTAVLDSISRADVLVGMDSFSVHAAHALGIPVVVLHGPFEPSVMTPPGGIPLSSGSLCKVFPCRNRPSCRNTEHEYICVRGIIDNTVVDAIESQLSAHC